LDKINNTFCVYPWINIHTNTDGRCKLCCNIYDEEYVTIGDKPAILGIDKWEDIWHGEYMQQVRKKMLAGEKVQACSRCYEHEQKGLISSRQWANKQNPIQSDRLFPIQSTDIYNPTHLELRLGNKCNLKCNSCWGVSSNSLYTERKNIITNEKLPEWLYNQWNHEIKSVEEFDWNWFETDEFRRFIADVAPTLKHLYLTGGEPTLISANKYVIDKLIEVGNKECYVCWTTNMTTWPAEFYDKLEFFDHSEIQMSIDGYGMRNSYIRYPTDWTLVEKHAALSQQLPDKVRLKLYFVYQAWNVFDVKNIINWIEETYTRRVDFVPIFLEHPDQIHSCVWPPEIKKKVISGLQTIKTTNYKYAIERMIEYTEQTDKFSPDAIERMKEFININDKYRKYKFRNIFPEFKEVLGL